MNNNDIVFRKAVKGDVPAIVEMLADDELGRKREDFRHPIPEKYYEAFARIEKDSGQELIVVEGAEHKILGTMQLSFISYLTYRGGIRAQVEAVRIRKDQRNEGLGEKMMKWAIKRARERGAHLLQLTTDKQRPKAIHFYEKLGFSASHEGMKMHF